MIASNTDRTDTYIDNIVGSITTPEVFKESFWDCAISDGTPGIVELSHFVRAWQFGTVVVSHETNERVQLETLQSLDFSAMLFCMDSSEGVPTR
eukprot:1970993-Amphidinium_carterae.2